MNINIAIVQSNSDSIYIVFSQKLYHNYYRKLEQIKKLMYGKDSSESNNDKTLKLTVSFVGNFAIIGIRVIRVRIRVHMQATRRV